MGCSLNPFWVLFLPFLHGVFLHGKNTFLAGHYLFPFLCQWEFLYRNDPPPSRTPPVLFLLAVVEQIILQGFKILRWDWTIVRGEFSAVSPPPWTPSPMLAQTILVRLAFDSRALSSFHTITLALAHLANIRAREPSFAFPLPPLPNCDVPLWFPPPLALENPVETISKFSFSSISAIPPQLSPCVDTNIGASSPGI